MLLLIGIVFGAAAVIIVQERYLPPRMSAGESAQLRSAYEQASGERQQLQDELSQTRQKLEAELAKNKVMAADLAASRTDTESLRNDVATVIESLPPDPRGGEVEVRAAQFVAKNGLLGYDIVLTRDGAGGKPISGVLQFIVSGDATRGGADTVTLQPISLSIGRHEVLRGAVPLPDGFRPRQTRVQVLDGEGGKALGMRVLLVR